MAVMGRPRQTPTVVQRFKEPLMKRLEQFIEENNFKDRNEALNKALDVAEPHYRNLNFDN